MVDLINDIIYTISQLGNNVFAGVSDLFNSLVNTSSNFFN